MPDVLDLYPEVTVVASKVALAYLKGLTHRPFTERAVKGGDKARYYGFHLHLRFGCLLKWSRATTGHAFMGCTSTLGLANYLCNKLPLAPMLVKISERTCTFAAGICCRVLPEHWGVVSIGTPLFFEHANCLEFSWYGVCDCRWTWAAGTRLSL